MKDRAQQSLSTPTAAIFAFLSMLSTAEVALAQSTRQFLDSSHPMAKAVAVIGQTEGSTSAGNGVVVGAGGCHVLTNYHVAFGKSKDAEGNVTLFEYSPNHQVLVFLDFDSKTTRFKREMKAKVIESGNYDPGTRAGLTEDYALLRLEACLGPGFGITAFEQNAEAKRMPNGKLSTIAFAVLDGKMGIVVEEECPPFDAIENRPSAIAPRTGSIGTNCFLQGGMSGSMLLATDGTSGTRLVGINAGKDQLGNGNIISFAVYARQFNKVLASALGEGSFSSPNSAGDRRP